MDIYKEKVESFFILRQLKNGQNINYLDNCICQNNLEFYLFDNSFKLYTNIDLTKYFDNLKNKNRYRYKHIKIDNCISTYNYMFIEKIPYELLDDILKIIIKEDVNY